jgi:multimeric flavodoxin WrbA
MAKVAVIYYGAADLGGCRLALAVAEGAWDAGAEVRVRRVERLALPAGAQSSPEWEELLRETEEVPEASAEDLNWADAVIFGTTVCDDAVRAQLGKLIHAILPVWGGAAMPLGTPHPTGERADDQERSPATEPAGMPTAAALTTARDQGRRIAETALALKSGGSSFAEVA